MDKQNLSKRASRLHLNSIALADGMKNGSFRSLYRGQGIELSGVREYLHGDDVRAIDWNVTARMSKPFVKMFEEEKELDVLIIMDQSLSMDLGAGRKTRIDAAIEAASLLTLASLKNSSPVGAVTFDGKIEFSCSPKPGKNQAFMLLKQYEKKNAKRKSGSALDNALRGAETLLRKNSLVVILSDFRTCGWEDSFGRLCQKNDVIALRITDPIDEKLPQLGSIPFIDPETNYECVLPTSSAKFARRWRETNEDSLDTWKHECVRHGGIPCCISTSSDISAQLIKFFTSREHFK